MSEPLGINRQHILRILANQPESTAGMKRRLSQIAAKPAIQAALEQLAAEKLIRLIHGLWHLTTLGRDALPKPPPRPAVPTYVPPTRNWRPGSDVALSLPSLFAGERVYR